MNEKKQKILAPNPLIWKGTTICRDTQGFLLIVSYTLHKLGIPSLIVTSFHQTIKLLEIFIFLFKNSIQLATFGYFLKTFQKTPKTLTICHVHQS